MKPTLATLALGAVAVGVLTGCAPVDSDVSPATSTPPAVTPTAIPTTTSAATPTAAAVGTRANPLPVGQMMKFSADSSWTVGATEATIVGEGWIALPLHVEIDWDNLRARNPGQDVDNIGANPATYVTVEFVSADGRTYYQSEGVSTELSPVGAEVGDVYPPTDSVTYFELATLPAEQVADGAWKLSNMNGAAVFIATQ